MLTSTEYRNIMVTLESFARSFQEVQKRLDALDGGRKPKIVRREGWVNVYPKDSRVNESKEEADACAGAERVACVRIEWDEEV